MAHQLFAEANALHQEVEQAVEEGRAEERLLPLLVKLADISPAGSDPWAYAVRQLAERTVGNDPWRASILARRLVDHRTDDDGGWALLGLAQSLLGYHRYAVQAYQRAVRLAPSNPWYAHNLGHLLDVALDLPERAAPLLARALAELRSWSRMTKIDLGRAVNEVAASYAHALLRCGDVTAARTAMRDVMRRPALPEHHELYSQILRAEDKLIEAAPATSTQRRRVKRSHKIE